MPGTITGMHTSLAPPSVPRVGSRISAVGLSTVHPDGSAALSDVSLAIEAGQLTAIIGPSGAGKTTLLATLAGVRAAGRGTVTFHQDRSPDEAPAVATVGFVPQDDILHLDLPLRATLRHAAALRLPTGDDHVLDAAVDDALSALGLTDHGHVVVRSLSGGQRKRASIACELLTRPGTCFLDEPTSGLDPASAAALVSRLRTLRATGHTVVFTTHHVADVEQSDRVVVLAPGGRLAFVGAPDDVLDHFGADALVDVYHLLDEDTDDRPPTATTVRAELSAGAGAGSTRSGSRPRHRGAQRPSWVRQWRVLTRRSAETMLANRLTLAILVGSPAAVIGMFAVLFRPDGFDTAATDPLAGVMVAYWLAFAGFFFGLTFGLLQVCAEIPVLRREHRAGVRPGAYVLSKLALLTPVLIVVNVTMIVVLRLLDRLPAQSLPATASLLTTMILSSVAALCLGLLASASVTSTAQAALALPMLCFPAVLFSGAMVPVPVMARAGQLLAAAMPVRWAFEAIARDLDVGAQLDPVSPHAGLGSSAPIVYWTVLVGAALLLGSGALVAVRRRAGGDES